MYVTCTQENCFKIRFTETELYDYSFFFNGEKYLFIHVLNEYRDELRTNEWHEVLPGIRLSDRCKYSSYVNLNNLQRWFWGFYYRVMGYCFEIEIDNKRNSYYFKSIKSNDKVSTEESPQICAEGTHYINVNPNLIDYPESMGGGAARCAVWALFEKLGLFSTFYYDYNMYSLSEILKNVTEHGTLIEVCRGQESCMALLKTFQAGAYRPEPYIRVCYEDGTYSVDDGNHRICVARRFDITQIPIKLTTFVQTDESEIYDEPSYSGQGSSSCKKVMTQYNSIIKNLGLSNEEGHFLLRTPIDGIDLIRYIEKVKGMSIDEVVQSIWADCSL